jgi:TorA maturation chaperone TorD
MHSDAERRAGDDLALSRAVVYRYLSDALRHPSRAMLSEREWAPALEVALEEAGEAALTSLAQACLALGADRERVESDYGRIIGHTPRAGVPPYESEWLGAAGDLLQFHQMSDVSAFYSAFGLKLNAACDERVDHIGIELAFLQFLCAKEAWAASRGDKRLAESARDAQRGFLRDHLARWTPAFCRKLGACGCEGFYHALAAFTSSWIARECTRLGVECGDPTLAPGESSVTLEDTCVSCAHASSCVPGGAQPAPLEELS